MKKISSYITKKFIFYFIAITLIISLFVAVVNLFETANMMTRKGEDISLKNVLFQIPYYLHLITPLITMLSAFMTFNYFVSTNEYKAIYASGYSKTVFLYPLITLSLAIMLFSLLFADKFSAQLYRKTKNKTEKPELTNLYIKKDNIFLGAQKADTSGILKDVYIEDVSTKRKIKTDTLRWDKKQNLWKAENGISIQEYSFVKTSSFTSMNIDFIPEPNIIIVNKLTDGNSYGIFELISRIQKLKKLSMKTTEETVFVYFKISLILINFIAVIVAFIFAQTEIIKNKSLSASVAMIISFIIWFGVIAAKRVADIEVIEPYMVALIPHSIFIIGSLYIIYRKKLI